MRRNNLIRRFSFLEIFLTLGHVSYATTTSEYFKRIHWKEIFSNYSSIPNHHVAVCAFWREEGGEMNCGITRCDGPALKDLLTYIQSRTLANDNIFFLSVEKKLIGKYKVHTRYSNGASHTETKCTYKNIFHIENVFGISSCRDLGQLLTETLLKKGRKFTLSNDEIKEFKCKKSLHELFSELGVSLSSEDTEKIWNIFNIQQEALHDRISFFFEITTWIFGIVLFFYRLWAIEKQNRENEHKIQLRRDEKEGPESIQNG